MGQTINNGRIQDEYLTPKTAVELIVQYLEPRSRIWCPFDKKDSQFVRVLRDHGHYVYFSHIDEGEEKDFFKMISGLIKMKEFDIEETGDHIPKYDYIISNPPFSKKQEVLESLYELGTPFAMLLPINSAIDGSKRNALFRRYGVELLIPDQRIKFINGLTGKIEGSPAFTSGYVCHNVLPGTLMFAPYRDCMGCLLNNKKTEK